MRSVRCVTSRLPGGYRHCPAAAVRAGAAHDGRGRTMAAASIRKTEISGGVRQIALAGFLDTAGATRLEAAFLAEVNHAPAGAVIDLSDVEFCGSSGIRLLLTAARVLKRSGGRLALAAPRPDVRSALEAVSLDAAIPIVDTAAGARGLVGAA